MKPRKTLVKKATAVSLSGTISNLARRAYNVLLAHAFDDLNEVGVFMMPAAEVFKALKIKSNNWDHLKLALKELKNTELEKDTLGIDGSGEWYADSLIIAPKIEGGVVRWEYSSSMRKLLRDKSAYIILNLQIHNNFTKHGLALYELALHWLPPGKRVGHSGLLSVADVRVLFGVGSSYPAFGQLNRAVLKNAIDSVNDINNKSEIFVEMETVKKQKTVVGVKFTVTRKKQEQADLVADVPERQSFEKMAVKKEYDEQEKLRETEEQSYTIFRSLDEDKQDALWGEFERKNALLFMDNPDVWSGKDLIKLHSELLPSFKKYLNSTTLLEDDLKSVNAVSREEK